MMKQLMIIIKFQNIDANHAEAFAGKEICLSFYRPNFLLYCINERPTTHQLIQIIHQILNKLAQDFMDKVQQQQQQQQQIQGLQLYMMNDYYEAIQYFEKALNIRPQHLLSLWAKIDCLLIQEYEILEQK
ncbi:unnamed protein product [Paramecium pentaurelia]|uniref:Tetratricopeptide repeat protein n=1 Tax=Paramecium pentaurelia TaxID=43138 RepID=A0A8S1XKI5_9CILI|nr:unnamed protein product [Paramecium pentaurelia]